MGEFYNIAVVDHDNSVEWIRDTLLKHGFTPVLFDSAIKCFRYFECHAAPDLIIANLYLPVISGWHFARMIRSPEFSYLNSIPIMAISSILEDRHAGLLRGSSSIDSFFGVPCGEADFIAAVHKHLNEGRPDKALQKLLVIDDDEAMGQMIKTALTRHNYTVNNALSAKQGVEQALDILPDVILLDHHLPGLSGIDIFPDLQVASDPVIITITADPDPNLSVRYAALGADAYIRKPFAVDTLLEIIRRAHLEKAMLAVESILAKRTNALAESNKRYKAIVEDQTELICRFLPDGTLTFINEAYGKYLGKTANPFEGKIIFDLIRPEDCSLFKNAIQSISHEQPIVTLECRLLATDGKIYWKHWTCRAIFNRQHRIAEYQAVGTDITDLKKAEASLMEAKTELENRVKSRTDELASANKMLREAMRKRRAAEEALLEITVREREKLGRDLHDQLGQQLAGITFMAKTLENRIKPFSLPESDRKDMALLIELANGAVKRVRDISRGLVASGIRSNELPELLNEIAETTSRIYGIKCLFNCSGGIKGANPDMFLHIYSITQEAVHNAVKHSNADTITINLENKNRIMTITVIDNGRGLPLNQTGAGKSGMGLHLMRMRARLLGSTLQIASSPETGTKISCAVDCSVARAGKKSQKERIKRR